MPTLSDLFDNQEFDPSTHESQNDFPICAPGKYPALIDKAEIRETKKRNGHYIYLEMTIMDGPCKGRKLFDRINIDNPNTQCVEIGLSELTALIKALALQGEEWKDLDLYTNKVVVAHVKVKKDQNEVRTYSSPSEQPQQAGAPVIAPAPVASRAPTPAPVKKEIGVVYSEAKPAPTTAGQKATAGDRPWDR